MVGAILTNKSAVTLDDVTPLARLTGEYEMLAVTTESPIKSMADFVDKLKADPGSVSWGGGSAGGTDQILVGLIAKAVGVDPTKVNYIAHSGGGEAMASILGGHVTVGVNGVAELLPQVQAGKLRPLAVSSEERVPGLDVPTLKEQGVDVVLTNWRSVMAPPQIKDADKQALSEMIAGMVKSKAWQETLKERGLDRPLPARGGVQRFPEEGPGPGGGHPEGDRADVTIDACSRRTPAYPCLWPLLARKDKAKAGPVHTVDQPDPLRVAIRHEDPDRERVGQKLEQDVFRLYSVATLRSVHRCGKRLIGERPG